MALSDPGLATLGEAPSLFFFSDGFAVDVAFVITVALAVLLSFLFSRPLSLSSIASYCIISV